MVAGKSVLLMSKCWSLAFLKAPFVMMNRVIKVNQLRFDTIIDRKFPFKEAGQAFEYLWSGIHVGKIVIELSED